MLDFLSTASIFPLHIFPAGGLASSVITTVWVGVFVVAIANLRFGWVMSGLIVPGYIVPLLLIKPSAAAVIMLEGILTYFCVWFYSEWLAQRMGWSRFFGRDRFFVMVLTSVAIRIVSDGYFLPMLGDYLNANWQYQFDYQNNLHSFGLIITALVANNFWKTGLARGSVMMLVTIGITYLIVRYGLMEFTNFSMSSIGFLYEDIASSFLASPKSYIILIVTAFIASRMNLYYGWDFSGILIPSLLALQWFAPMKIVMSLVEAVVILLLAIVVLRAPIFKRLTIEGARKVLLFFNISFAYKLLLSHCLLWFWPTIKVSDFYGFGYLLPTLIALKMHDKNIFGRMSTSLLQTSIAATAVASLLGFGLSLLSYPLQLLPSQAITRHDVKPLAWQGTLAQAMQIEKQAAYRSLAAKTYLKPSPLQAQSFNAALQILQQENLSARQLDEVAALLHAANFALHKNGQLLLILEQEPRKFWGSFAINLAAENRLFIQAPTPIDEPGTLEAASILFQELDARFLAVAGGTRRASADGSADVLVFPNSLFQQFHRSFARRNVLQVRAHEGSAASQLRIKGEIPLELNLPQLQRNMGALAVQWQSDSAINMQRDTSASGFAELSLGQADIAQIVLGTHSKLASIDGNIGQWLAINKLQIAATGSNLYRAPTAGELIYLDKDIFTPLLQSLQRPGTMQQRHRRWQMIHHAAQALGYQLQLLHSSSDGEDFLLLSEDPQAQPRRYWGSYAFRLQGAQPNVVQPYVVQVPRPYFEPNSLELGIRLFQHMKASSIMIAASSPLANQDHSADLLALPNKANVFNLLNQVMLRESGASPSLTLQTRALAQTPGQSLPEAEVLIGFSNGVENLKQASSLGRGLMQSLQAQGLRYQFANGQARTSEYGASAALQGIYQNTGQNKELALLWASPLANAQLRQQHLPEQGEATAQHLQFKALGIASAEMDVQHILSSSPHAQQALPKQLEQQLNRYLQQQDVVLLHEVQREVLRNYPALRLQYLIDKSSHRSFLVLWQGEQWLAALNLSSKDPQRVQTLQVVNNPNSTNRTNSTNSTNSMSSQTRSFLSNNMTWLKS